MNVISGCSAFATSRIAGTSAAPSCTLSAVTWFSIIFIWPDDGAAHLLGEPADFALQPADEFAVVGRDAALILEVDADRP